MNEPPIEEIHSIEWSHRIDAHHWKHVTLYPSGFINLNSDGWHQVEDLPALQSLFDLAKDAVRSRPAPADVPIPDKPLWVRIRTTEGIYIFEEDVVKLKDTTVPACHPFEWDKDGHADTWKAAKSRPVIDYKLRR